MKRRFDGIYIEGLDNILTCGKKEYNSRKKSNTTRYFGLVLKENDVDHLSILHLRKQHPQTIAAELAWTLLGTQSTNWINNYTKIWKKFEDEPGIVKPAYGYRWRKHFGRDQILDMIAGFKKDRANRHSIVSAWDAGLDGLLNVGTYKNTPCPHIFGCNIIDDKLNLHVTQRSADYLVGVPYDFAMYSLLLNAVAKSTDSKPGTLMFTLLDAHIYEALENNISTMKKNFSAIMQQKEYFNTKLDSPSVEEIIKNPDDYVSFIKDYAKTYNPIDNLKNFKVIQ